MIILHSLEEERFFYPATRCQERKPAADRIRSYGFAFQGKQVLIGGGRHADYRTADSEF